MTESATAPPLPPAPQGAVGAGKPAGLVPFAKRSKLRPAVHALGDLEALTPLPETVVHLSNSTQRREQRAGH